MFSTLHAIYASLFTMTRSLGRTWTRVRIEGQSSSKPCSGSRHPACRGEPMCTGQNLFLRNTSGTLSASWFANVFTSLAIRRLTIPPT
ncbi:hypothetical protein IQ07DRAFT_50447 [Pyrenochaeta sp. DS3sAY3a]|nr:hypothetical protein IQ07DRAFT_50447 [Pyrenochaeta sp. DS3sAY3a]